MPAFFGMAGLIFPLPARADGLGTSAAEFLQLGYGARALGMAEAYTAVSDDAAALYYNPAGLGYPAGAEPNQGRYEGTLTESLDVQSITMTQAGFVSRPWGVSLTRLDYGSLEGRQLETDSASNFSASDMAISVTGAHRFEGPNFSLGASGRFIEETIATYHATAYALDLGALKRFESLPVSLGAALTNVGTPVRFVSQSSPLPATLSLGVAYGMTKSFPHVLSVQVDLPRGGTPAVCLGAEYSGFGPLALRFGYRTFGGAQRAAVVGTQLGQTYSGISGFYGLFLGAGLRTRWGDFDYAIEPYGDLGMENRMSVNVRFGKPKAAGDAK